jgi:hypothetical protein
MILFAASILFQPLLKAEVSPFELASVYEHTNSRHKDISLAWALTALHSGYLSNVRFFSPFFSDIPHPTYPPHRRLNAKNNNAPQNATALILQHLFPSSNGHHLFHNAYKHDPIGNIAIEAEVARKKQKNLLKTVKPYGIGRIELLIKLVRTYRQSRLELGSIAKNYFIRAACLALRAQMDDNFRHSDVCEDPSRWLKFHTSSHFEYDIAVFVLALEEAIRDESENKNVANLLPPNFIEIALLAFAIKAAETPDELQQNLPSLFIEGKTIARESAKQIASEASRAFLTKLESRRHSATISADEWLFFLTHNQSPIARLLVDWRLINQEGDGYSYRYTNCGSAAIRNWFNIMLESKGRIEAKTLQHVQKKIAMHTSSVGSISGLRSVMAFFKKHPDPSNANSLQAHLDWENVTSSLNIGEDDPLPIKYEKGHQEKKTHALDPADGLYNMLNLFTHLLPTPTMRKRWPEEKEKKLAVAALKLTHLCDLFSRDGFTVTWDSESGELASEYPDIVFAINGEPSFVWSFKDWHYEISPTSPNKDWRNFVNYLPTQYPWLVTWLTSNLEPTQSSTPRQILEKNLKEPKIAIAAIETILENRWMSLYPSISAMFNRLVPFLADIKVQQQLIARLYGYVDIIVAESKTDRRLEPIIKLFSPPIEKFYLEIVSQASAATMSRLANELSSDQRKEAFDKLLRQDSGDHLFKMEFLLDADTTLADRMFHTAVDWKLDRVVDLIIKKGADPNGVCTVLRETALEIAVRKRDLQTISVLLQAGAIVDETLVHHVEESGDIEMKNLFSVYSNTSDEDYWSDED